MSIINGKYNPVVLVNPSSEDMAGHLLDVLEHTFEEAVEYDDDLREILFHIKVANKMYRRYQED